MYKPILNTWLSSAIATGENPKIGQSKASSLQSGGALSKLNERQTLKEKPLRKEFAGYGGNGETADGISPHLDRTTLLEAVQVVLYRKIVWNSEHVS